MKRLRVYLDTLSVTSSLIPAPGSAKIQYYDADLQEYSPDFRLVPFVFGLKASVTADGTIWEVTNFIDTVVEEEIAGTWTKKNSTSTFVINVEAGSVMMYENTNQSTNRKFRMTAKIADPRNPAKYVIITEQFTLISEILATSPFVIKESYPDGQSAHVLKKLDNYKLHAPLYRGTKEWFYTYYRWFTDKAGSWEELTDLNADGITGLNTPLLNVPFYSIPLEGLKMKVIADPVLDTSGINLISKKMISEDWNNIHAGISTEEEDEDGKYFNVNYSDLYSYVVGRDKGNDIFFGRIKYKANQQYILSVKWKLDSELSLAGMIFYIIYTDNTTVQLTLAKNQTTPKYDRLITSKNKTIQKIRTTYGAGAYAKIYDIQLIEYAGIANLCKNSGTLKSGTSAGFPLSNVLEVGKTYRFALDYKCKNKANVYVLDNTTTDRYGSINLNPSSEFTRAYSDTFTIKEGFNSSSAILYMYGGAANDNFVEIKNAFLCEGGKIPEIWYPAEGEFIPAIPDGALKPDISRYAMTTTMALTKLYPNPVNKEISISADGNLPSLGSLFAGECTLTGNVGLIENPQNFYSCIWRKRPVSTGLWSELAKGFGIISTMEEEMDVDVVIEKGLQNAKYMACFNGIDNYLRMLTPDFFTNTTPLFSKIYKLDFIVFSVSNNLDYIVDFRHNTMHRVAITINKDRNLAIYTTLNKRYHIDKLELNKMYQLVAETNDTGELINVLLNGKVITFQEAEYQFAASSANVLTLGANSANLLFNGSILSFDLIDTSLEADTILHFDFQPTDGNRDNMLKNKKLNGLLNTQRPYDFEPINIANFEDTNPETGFFRPAPAKTGLLNK